MRCRKCRAKAILRIPRHNTAFCPNCFDQYIRDQVDRAIREDRMLTREDRVAVAVSGGKDSLALWDLLHRLGYATLGIHVHLGIGGYSSQSYRKVEAFARIQDLPFVTHDLRTEYGGGIHELSELTDRSPCSACGVIKRYSFNKIALDAGCTVVATGHNLDDEAARLLGNLLHWQEDYLAKQSPALPSTHEKLLRKVKPLYRIAEREVAAYSVMRRIDYIVEECPMSRGSKMLVHKEVLNRLEEDAPGTKQSFYWGFLKRQRGQDVMTSDARLTPCGRCGHPTTSKVCAHCRLVEKLTSLREAPF
jgi:tRNA-5-methyluridine54 2-sulfurtransferase